MKSSVSELGLRFDRQVKILCLSVELNNSTIEAKEKLSIILLCVDLILYDISDLMSRCVTAQVSVIKVIERLIFTFTGKV